MATTLLRRCPELVHSRFRVVVVWLRALWSADIGIGIVHVAHGSLAAVWIWIGVDIPVRLRGW
jgi:hypothetical protein